MVYLDPSIHAKMAACFKYMLSDDLCLCVELALRLAGLLLPGQFGNVCFDQFFLLLLCTFRRDSVLNTLPAEECFQGVMGRNPILPIV